MLPDPTRHAWRTHYGFLAAMAVLYAILTWDAWFPPPGKTLNLEVIGAVGLLIVCLVYASATTFVMFWVARYRWPPLVIHIAAFALAGLLFYRKHREHERRTARYAAEEEDRRLRDEERHKLATCLHLDLLDVSLGPPMRASLTFVNQGCPVAKVVRDVDLFAFQAGGNRILTLPFGAQRDPVRLEPGARHTFALETALPSGDRPSTDGWSFRVNVDLEEQELSTLCYLTPGAPETSGCNRVDHVSVAPGP